VLKIDSVCKLGKTIKATSKKDAKGVPTTIASIKFSELKILGIAGVNQLLGEKDGWAQTALYDDQGIPRKRFGISVYGRLHRVSGGLNGPKPNQALVLLQADLEEVWLQLTPSGALAEGMLTWAARGDEIEDVSEILGTLVRAVWEITDGGQDDMFDPQGTGAARATQATQDIIDKLGRKPS
jgi:hypothetical protein